MKQPQSTQGFTLLEMLVTLAVLGILLSIGFMSAAGWREKLRADNFLAELTSDFNVSRTRTLATGQVRRIRLVDARNYVIETAATKSGPWTVIRTSTYPKPILDFPNTMTRKYVFSSRGFVETYNQTGQLTSSTTIKALLGSGLKTISVTALGIARRE